MEYVLNRFLLPMSDQMRFVKSSSFLHLHHGQILFNILCTSHLIYIRLYKYHHNAHGNQNSFRTVRSLRCPIKTWQADENPTKFSSMILTEGTSHGCPSDKPPFSGFSQTLLWFYEKKTQNSTNSIGISQRFSIVFPVLVRTVWSICAAWAS